MTDTSYNRDKLEAVVSMHSLDAATADMLRLAHEIDVRQGIDGTVTYNNGASNFGDWMRRTVAERPYLVAKTSTAHAETAPPAAPKTTTEVMLAVRDGRMSPADATRQLLSARPAETRPAPGIPDAPTFAGDTMTALMARAKAGDKSAIAAITAKYLNPNR